MKIALWTVSGANLGPFSPATLQQPCLVPRRLSLWIKICTQRKMGRRKRAKWRFASLLLPSHGRLRFVTSHSRFALDSMRNTKRLRRRQVTDHKKGDRPPQNSPIMQGNIHLILREKWRFFSHSFSKLRDNVIEIFVIKSNTKTWGVSLVIAGEDTKKIAPRPFHCKILLVFEDFTSPSLNEQHKITSCN